MIWVLLPFAVIGLADCYILYRWIRKPEVDYTAGALWYWCNKWMMVTQSKLMAEKLGYPGKDLSEVLLGREDGKTT